MLIKLLLVIALINCVSFRQSGAEFTIDGECTIPHSGAKGNCKLLKNCHSATEAYRNKLTPPPTKCGFLDQEEIVCCAIEAKTTATLRINPIASSKRVQKCEEYAKSVYEERQLILLTNTTTKTAKADTCGLTAVLLIDDGLHVRSREFPHFALLGINGTFAGHADGDIEWICGGSLVSTRYVLTAAHCLVTRKGPVQIARFGDFVNDRDFVDMMIQATHSHPDFKSSLIYNDIGLVKMANNIKFSKFIRPMCLPTTDKLPPRNKVMALGWDFTSFGNTTDKNKLLRAATRTLSNEECKIYFEPLLFGILRNGITDKQICTESIKDLYFDSFGEILQIYHPDTYCMYTQIGVASFVTQNAPGVYTAVFKYSDWIEDVIWGSGADD